MLQDHLPLLTRLAEEGEPLAIATIIEIRGSASARPGSKAVIDRKGKVLSGSVGGGCAQSTVCGTAVECPFYPAAARLLAEDLDYGQLAPEAEDCAVVATQHKGDHQSILRLLESPVGSIALIASRKRSSLVLDYLRENGIAEDQIARVRAPAGLDIGAATPEEIALSVMSEIVMLRRQGSGKAMRLHVPARISELID